MTAPTLTRSEWLALRATGLGSSDAAAACGESKTSPAELCLQKRGIMHPDDISELENVLWGNIMEPHIVEQTAIQRRVRLLDPVRDRETIERELQATGETEVVGWIDGRQAFLRSVSRPWQHAAIDGIGVEDSTGLIDIEAKNVGQYHSGAWNTEDGRAPPKFDCQVGHQLAVAPAFTVALLSGLVGGNNMRVLRRERAEMLGTISAIITLEAEVWRCVQEGTMPAFDGSESHIRALRALHPADNGQTVSLSESLLALHEELQDLKPLAAKAEKRIKEIRREIEAAMDGNTYGVLPGATGTYSNKWQDRAEYVAKAVSFPVLRFEKYK